MPTFRIHGFTPDSRTVNVVIQAADERSAESLAQDRNIFPTKIVRERGLLSDPTRIKLSRMELAELFTHLELQVGSGILAVEAIRVLKDRLSSPRLRALMREIHDYLSTSKGDLTAAFSQFPRTFPKDILTVLAAGEKTGTLDLAFKELRERVAFVAELRRTIRSALQYPLILAVLGFSLIVYFMSFTVPKLTAVLEELQTELPPLTRRVIAVSDWFEANWLLTMVSVLTTITAYYLARRSPRISLKIDTLLLKIPIYGSIMNQLSAALFARVYRSLYISGEPMLLILDLCSELVPNLAIKSRIRRAARYVRDGEGLGLALEHAEALPPEACSIITSGESSGTLRQALLSIADFYSSLAKHRIGIATAWLGPAILIIGGSIIGVVVVAMFLPIANLANQIR